MPEPLIGEHPSLRHVRKRIPLLAASSEPLLIVGEHGTGKSLIAEHIHSQSPFAKNNQVTLDCSLLEDRYQRIFLFGAVPPALTTTRRSPLEITTTLVIKNPDAAFPYLQEKLAFTLRTQEVRRFESAIIRPVLARVVLLLTKKPEELKKVGKLHASLYNFLSHCRRISIPPLRHRKNDIPLLFRYFADHVVQQRRKARILGTHAHHRPDRRLIELLKRQAWNGNVAELKSCVHALVVPSPEEVVQGKENLLLAQAILMMSEGKDISLKKIIAGLQKMLVARALHECKGNEMTASRRLGLTNVSVRRIMRGPL